LSELDFLDLCVYKVASTDTKNLQFLKKIAKKYKPIFLSTGMSYLSEVALALKTICDFNKNVVLFQCMANYSIQDKEANLKVLDTYKDNFEVLFHVNEKNFSNRSLWIYWTVSL
jgi:N,N'-diacetyllegionaminate synthase